VPPNTVWLESENPRSWDSRYYGPIAIRYVRARAYPVLTYGMGGLIL
jgi:type IV secretory pathway protease TraF